MYKVSKKNTTIEELEADYYKTVEMLEKALINDIAYVDSCTESDFVSLMSDMLSNMAESIELMQKITAVRDSLAIMYQKRNRLLPIKNISSKDVIDNLSSNINAIVNVHGFATIAILLSTANPSEFLKRMLAMLMISLSSFGINYTYMTSDYRKNRANTQIKKLDKYIKIDELALKTFTVCDEFYKKVIDYENAKLIKIAPGIEEGESIEDFLRRILPEPMAESFIEKANQAKKGKIRKRSKI